MKTLNIVLICFVAILLHSTVMKLFSFGFFRPDLILFVLVYFSLREGSLAGIWIGFCVGFLQDAYRPSSLGVNAFAKALVGYLVGFFNERQWKIDAWARSVLLLVSFLTHDLIVYLVRHGGVEGLGRQMISHSLPSFLYTYLLWVALWFFLQQKGKTA